MNLLKKYNQFSSIQKCSTGCMISTTYLSVNHKLLLALSNDLFFLKKESNL